MSRLAVDPRSAALLMRWTLVCGAAELLGIAAGAAWWIAWDQVEPEPVTALAKASMLLAKGLSGAVEGLVLGAGQAWLLGSLYPDLNRVAWVAATAALAVAGWMVGSSFAIYGGGPGGQSVDPGPAATALLASGFGAAVGAIFGAVQALVLMRAATRSWVWIAANALGWALALPAIYLAASSGGGAAALPLAAASGVVAGLLLGLVTGTSLRWMPRKEAFA